MGLQDTFAEKLLDDGWTVPLFAVSASSLERFENEIDGLLGDVAGIITPIQRSALKLTWQECQPQSTSASSTSRLEQPQSLVHRLQDPHGLKASPPN